MQALNGEWNGDVDLLDGALQKLRKEFDDRMMAIERLGGQLITDASSMIE